MKPIHLTLRQDYSSSSSPQTTPETRYIKIDHEDLNHNDQMDAGEPLVVLEESVAHGEYWKDEYTLTPNQLQSSASFRNLLTDIFSKRSINKSIAVGAENTDLQDQLIFIAPPEKIGDDPEIQATFDPSNGKKSEYN